MQRLLDTRLPERWEENLWILTSRAKTRREWNGRFRELMVTREDYERERKRSAFDNAAATVR